MRQITPIDAALELIDCLEGGEDLPGELKEWLLRAFKLCRSGAVKNLDEGLGLSVGPGQARDRLCYVWLTRERNRLVRECAAQIQPEYGKVMTAKIIAFTMEEAVPKVETADSWQTMISLAKLRTICINHKGDTPLAIGWKRTLEIMNGDGC